MSKIPSTSHPTTAEPKPRPTKDLRLDDIRSPPKITVPSTQIKNSEKSPRQVPPGAGYACITLKSPRERGNPIKTPTEKDLCSPELKGTVIRKDSKKNSVSISVAGKPSNNSVKATNKAKSPTVSRENLTNKQVKKLEDMGFKDLKTPIMTDISEKAATPGNLKLTLENIGAKTGSQTHRVTLNSPTSSASNRFGGLSPIQKKNKGIAVAGGDAKEKQNNERKAKGELNMMLVGLPKQNIGSKRSSKISGKDSCSVSGTPRLDHEDLNGTDEDTTTMKKYKELLGMLKEKEREIKKLAQDKSELQSTLSCMGEELVSLRKASIFFKERGKSVADLPDGLSNLNLTHSIHTHQRSVDNSSVGDMRPSNIPNGLMMGLQCSVQGYSDRTGKTWNQSVEGKVLMNEKRPNQTNNSSDNMQIGGRSSLTTSPNEESMRLRYDTYAEDNIDAKEETMDKKQKKKKIQQNGKTVISGQSSPKKAKKGPVGKKKREATSVDQGKNLLMKSIEEKDMEMVDTQRSVKKKHPEFKSMTQFTFGVSKEGQQQNIDIGEALGELKNRVERLLKNRDRLSVTKTQLLYQNLHDKLQKVL